MLVNFFMEERNVEDPVISLVKHKSNFSIENWNEALEKLYGEHTK